MALFAVMPAALVIGARNFGFAIIERLLADGWSVSAGARSAETLAKVRGVGARPLEIDVTDQASVLASPSPVRSMPASTMSSATWIP